MARFGFITLLLTILTQTNCLRLSPGLNLPFSLQPAGQKPHLNCILFGDTACQITCDVLCDLYGCRSNARCVDNVSCQCNEIYPVGSSNLTVQQYRNLSLAELWKHNFKDSFASSQTLKRIVRNDILQHNITALLRNPHITGDYVKGSLTVIRATWIYVYYLRANPRGRIQQLLDTSTALNYEKFADYFNATIDEIVSRKYQQIRQMENLNALPSLLGYLKDETNVRYIVSQLLWFPNNSLLDLISDYTHRVRFFDTNATLAEQETSAYENFKTYLGHAIENLVDQVYGKVQQMKTQQQLPRLMSYIKDRDDIKHMITLMLMYPDDSIYNLMRNLVLQNRNETYTVKTRKNYELLNPQDIDDLVFASVLERLLKIKIHAEDSTTAAPTTTPSTTTTSVPFRLHIQRLLRETFGMRANDVKPLETEKKKHPQLRQLLEQLMEYLIEVGNFDSPR